MGKVEYADATAHQRKRADEEAEDLQAKCGLQELPVCTEIGTKASGSVIKKNCTYLYPSGCQVQKENCLEVAECTSESVRKNFRVSGGRVAFVCDSDACRTGIGLGKVRGAKTGRGGGIGVLTEQDMEDSWDLKKAIFAAANGLDPALLDFYGGLSEDIAAFEGRSLEYPCMCDFNCGKKAHIAVVNAELRKSRGEPMFMTRECNTRWLWQEQLKPGLLTIPGIDPALVKSLTCTEIRRTSVSAVTGRPQAYRGISPFELCRCDIVGCNKRPLLTGGQLDNRISLGIFPTCPSHQSVVSEWDGKKFMFQTMTEQASVKSFLDEHAANPAFTVGNTHAAFNILCCGKDAGKHPRLPKGLSFIPDWHITFDQSWDEDDILIQGRRYKQVLYGQPSKRITLGTEDATVAFWEKLAGGRGKRMIIGDSKGVQYVVLKPLYGESVKAVRRAGFESETHVYNTYGDMSIDYSSPKYVISNEAELQDFVDDVRQRMKQDNVEPPAVPMFLEEDGEPLNVAAIKKAVGNPSKWFKPPSEDDDQALITDYYGPQHAFKEDQDEEEPLGSLAAVTAASRTTSLGDSMEVDASNDSSGAGSNSAAAAAAAASGDAPSSLQTSAPRKRKSSLDAPINPKYAIAFRFM